MGRIESNNEEEKQIVSQLFFGLHTVQSSTGIGTSILCLSALLSSLAVMRTTMATTLASRVGR